MALKIKTGQKVLFTGDSITDCGRRDANSPLGSGYVRIVHDLLLARYPQHKLNVINTGISGNTVRDLAGRWTDDVIRHQPHWLSIKIGINDIHRWLRELDTAVSPEEFAELYEHILARTRKETKANIVLVEPFYISTDKATNSFRSSVLKHLPAYIRTVRKLARKYKALHVPLHDVFQNHLKRDVPDRFCPEPVHPNQTGHTVIAHAWLKTLGY